MNRPLADADHPGDPAPHVDGSADPAAPDPSAAVPPQRFLVLGGTSWLGGAVARVALTRGHEVVCLARGESGAVPEGARLVRADRAEPTAYAAVAGIEFDAVVDVSWQPEFVRSALDALAASVGDWVYVSSVSVYRDDSTPAADESAPTHPRRTSPGPAGIDEYATAKVACEAAVRECVGAARCTIARAGLIAGYGDRSDRFGYWPGRLARVRGAGEPVLVPPLARPVQVIDVADLATWLVRCAELRTPGAFNAVGDAHPLGEVLAACQHAAGTDASLLPATDEWLLEHHVEPYMGPESLPLWLPGTEYAGHATRRNAAAKAAGLHLRPIADTVRDALAWERELGLGRARKAGLSPGREASLVAELTGAAGSVSR